MTMRAPSEELPIIFDGVSVTAGDVTILDNLALTLTPVGTVRVRVTAAAPGLVADTSATGVSHSN